jgi:hypothetical protein
LEILESSILFMLPADRSIFRLKLYLVQRLQFIIYMPVLPFVIFHWQLK